MTFVSNLPKNTRFGLYSWAVHNKSDLEYFLNEEKEWVEKMFGFRFDKEYLYTLENVMDMVQNLTNKTQKFNHTEFFKLFNKENSMLELLKSDLFKNKHLFLVDDMVNDNTFSCKENNSKVTFVNVDKLPSF